MCFRFINSRYCFVGLLVVLIFSIQTVNAQTILKADINTDTYELINSVLAPGHNVVETPDCVHTTEKHIDQVFDNELDEYVFRFKMHKHPDNDRCKNFDRQRTEIKTYDKSPANLKATLDEKIEYTWKFKISSDFQSSSKFTHLHQIKSVGGPDESMPLITLTARKSSPDRLELRYAEELNQITLAEVPIAAFKGEWIEAKEVILFQEKNKATYTLELVRMRDSMELFSYSTSTLKMWKTDADFLRPKWGIYRSLEDSNSIKDENVLFTDFSITELETAKNLKLSFANKNEIFPNPFGSELYLSKDFVANYNELIISDLTGHVLLNLTLESDKIDVSQLVSGTYLVQVRNSLSGDLQRRIVIKL